MSLTTMPSCHTDVTYLCGVLCLTVTVLIHFYAPLVCADGLPLFLN